MKTKFFFITLLCFFLGKTLAQEKRQKYIGIEGGMDFIYSEMTKMDYVRGDVPSYYQSGKATNNLKSLLYKEYSGLKTEIFSLNNKFGFLGGIRFTRMHASIGKNSYWADSPNFFYLLYSQDGTTTEYLKIKEISQKSDYLGIPIEVRIFPFRPHLFRIYFKVGAEFNYRLQTKTDVVFYDDAMNSYENSVSKIVSHPGSFSSDLYGGVGVRIGRPSKPAINIEGCLPSVFLTNETTGLIIPRAGFGFQLNIQIPF